MYTKKLHRILLRLELREGKLNKSNERHRLFFENAPIGIIHYNKTGIITEVNEAMATIFGSSREQLIGLNIDVIPDKAFAKEVYKSLAGERGHYEGKYLSYTGNREIYINAVWIPLLDKGEVVCGVGIVEDYTARELAHKALKESERRLQEGEAKFRGLVELSSDWIWEVDKDGVYTYSSPQVEKMLGYKPEDLIGKTPFDFMPPEEVERMKLFFKESVGKAVPIVAQENINLHKNGQYVTLETSGAPFFDETGEIVGYRGIDRDITDRKKIENEKEQLFTKLQQAFDEIKTLEGILPLCSHCKKIRNDNDEWLEVDTYIHRYSEADISHGICPKCAKKHYPEEFEKLFYPKK